MRTPGELSPLTEAEKRHVAEIEAKVEEVLAKGEHFHANTNEWKDDETGKLVSRRVWETVVANADKAGWRASLSGATVAIALP